MNGKQRSCAPRLRVNAATVLLVLVGCATAWGQTPQSRRAPVSAASDLTQVSIENLMDVEVSSVSKKDQRLLRTAAAVFILTQDDIRRSGATNIPDLLRLVPGLAVAQIDASDWAVTSRGFNGRFANKLLVLIDGRSLYSPDFAGVLWQVQNLMLEDIDRIEVIRGPGATLWGANAVTGVINILTKKSNDTQGGLLSVGGGMQERVFTGARYGMSKGESLAYRFYGNYFNRGEFQSLAGQGTRDNWDGVRTGFRLDSQPTQQDTLMVEGDIHRDAAFTQTHVAGFTPPFNTTPLLETTYAGGHVLGRWTRSYSPHSEFSVHMYYETLSRDNAILNVQVHVFDIEFQERSSLGARHDLIWVSATAPLRIPLLRAVRPH